MESIEHSKSVGSTYLSPEITSFLFDLVSLPKDGNILVIGINQENVKHIPISAEIDFAPSSISPEELDKINKSYDRIVCAPVFGLNINFKITQPSEEFWLKWGVEHLTANGQIAIFVPIGLLSNYSQEPIRKHLLDKKEIIANIELPSGWTQSSSIQANILLIGTNKANNKEVSFLKLLDYKTINWKDVSQSILDDPPKAPQKTSNTFFSIPTNKLKSSRLDLSYYDPEYADIAPQDKSFEVIKLKDLVEIRSGNRFSLDAFKPKGIPLLQIKNIDLDGNIDLIGTKKIDPETAKSNRSYIEPDDVVISISGTVGKVAHIPLGEICIDTSLRRLRILDQNIILPKYLALFLSSSNGHKQIKRFTSGSVMKVLSSPNLQEIIIFVPPIEKQLQIIREYNKLRMALIGRLQSVFPIKEKMQELLIPQLTIVEKVMHPERTIEEIIQTEYPFPIAYPYFIFLNSRTESAQSRLKKLIDVSEAVVYYIFGILMADQIHRLQIDDSKLNEIANMAIYGFSIDRQLEFIRYILKETNDHPDHLFIPEITETKHNICSQIHNVLRNKISHNKSQPEAWCKQNLKEYEPKIIKLLESLSYLREYKLATVTNLTRKDKQFQHHMMDFLGIQNPSPHEIVDFENIIEIDTNRVFILDKDNIPLDMHPFYVMHAWQSTGMQSHLCFMKQITGKEEIKVESIAGAGEDKISAPKYFIELIPQ